MRRRLVVAILLVVFLAIIVRSPRRPSDEPILPTVAILPSLTPIASMEFRPDQLTAAADLRTVRAVTLTAVSTPAFTPEFGLAMDMAPISMYAQGEVVLRVCPSRECASVGSIPDGAALLVDGIINGEAVSAGNAIWYRSTMGSAPVYVYSEIVTDRPTAVAPISTAASPYACNGVDDLNCSDFSAGAQAHLLMCGDEDLLDADRDGVACEDG